MSSNRGKRFPVDPLTPAEAASLIEACNPRWRTGKRNRAHIALLWRCGLRSAEACSLDLSDFREGDPCTIRVLQPKGFAGGKGAREQGLDARTCGILRAWIKVRGDGPGPLLSTATGARLATSYMRRALPRLAARAGITRRVHPHALRHGFARGLYDEQVGIVHIQRALGHSNLGTTARYLQSIGASEVVAVLAGREW